MVALPGVAVLFIWLFWMKVNKDEIENAEKRCSGVDSAEWEGQGRGDSVEHAPVNGNDNEDDIEPTLQFTLSSLFSDFVEGDPWSHSHDKDTQQSFVDNSHLNVTNDNHDRFSDETDASIQIRRPDSPTVWSSIRNEPRLAKKLVGTAGTWFLFDIVFYGNTLFEPLAFEAALGSKSGDVDGYDLLIKPVRDPLLISLLSLPGHFVTVLLIGRRTCVCRSLRRSSPTRCSSLVCSPFTQTQSQSFIVMIILYLIIGIFWTSLSNIQSLLLPLCRNIFLRELWPKLNHIPFAQHHLCQRVSVHSERNLKQLLINGSRVLSWWCVRC